MTEISFPVVDKPLGEDDWKTIALGFGQGIIDRGGWPYLMGTKDNVNNTITINVDQVHGRNEAILSGFVHRIDSPKVITIPAVTTTTTYEVGLVYDPLKHSTPEGPITLTVWTSPGDYTQGKNRLILYKITRNANQVLTDATVTENRQRISPQLSVSQVSDLPKVETLLVDTVALVRNTNEWYRLNKPGTGPQTWVAVGGNVERRAVAEDANTIPLRTSSGSIRASDPIHVQDVATRNYCLTNYWLKGDATGGTVDAAGKLVLRGSDANFLVPSNPTHSQHPVPLGFANSTYFRKATDSLDAERLNKSGNAVWWEIVSGSTRAYSDTNGGSTWATVGVTSAGKFFRYTSARKYKKDLKPIDWTLEECLAPVPHTYTDIQSGEERIGFPADDYVGTRVGKYLVQWGDLDHDGDDEVEGWHYFLTPVVQQRALHLLAAEVLAGAREREVLRRENAWLKGAVAALAEAAGVTLPELEA